MKNLQGAKVAVLGAGLSGLGAAKLALQLGATPVVFDDGDPLKLEKAVARFAAEGIGLKVGLDEARRACGELKFDLAVISPGLDAGWLLPRLFTEAGVPLVGELEFAWQPLKQTPVVGITGTNGKTTTTELVARILEGCGRRTVACGNYGLALSEVALRAERCEYAYDVLTVEVSSFQLETIVEFRPRVAVWLNFAADHLDRYPDMESYLKAKLRMFDNMTAEDTVVIRAGENIAAGLASRVITFTTETGVEADFALKDGRIWFRDEPLIETEELPLRERHNIENEMAALAAGWSLGLGFPETLEALRGYEAARHRCELVATVMGRRYVNDSKATNLHATETCLRSQDVPVVWIAGGKEKGLDYAPLKPLLAEKVTVLVAIGEISEKLTKLFAGVVTCHQAATVPEAVRIATQVAEPGQPVVFSPGTSSFDMFSGYVERGNVFREAVLDLIKDQC